MMNRLNRWVSMERNTCQALYTIVDSLTKLVTTNGIHDREENMRVSWEEYVEDRDHISGKVSSREVSKKN
jgi:hypothetical protein